MGLSTHLAICTLMITALTPRVIHAQTFEKDPTHLTSLIQEQALDNPTLGAAGANPRVLLPIALDLIKDFEAWKPIAYNDASNYCTIGYGHLIKMATCEASLIELASYAQPLSFSSGIALLDSDTKLARLSVQALVKKDMTDEQFGALTSFVFNVGADNLSKSLLLKYINNGEYDGAARQFRRWVKCKGEILPGLIARRSCEASLFKGTLHYGADGKFHREDCQSLGAVPATEFLIDVVTGEPQ